MRITWVTRSFLDYRIPVFQTLANFPDVEFKLISSGENWATPPAVREKTQKILGDKVQFLYGEKCLGTPYSPDSPSNARHRIFYQPGLIKAIKATRPDVVITDAFNHWTLPVFWLRSHSKIKHIVCYERTAWTERTAPWLKRKFISFMQHWIDAVHYNGVLCHDFLRTLGYPERKLKFGNMTLDVKKFQGIAQNFIGKDKLKAQYNINPQDIVFLYIGRISHLKGIKYLLEAWENWSNKSSAKLLMVGDGSLRQELTSYCQQKHLDNVIFTGPMPYEKIPEICSIANVFVIPTLEDNWSLVVPEAMSCHLPIMCSIYNGCHPELVTKENGWTFDPLDEQSIVSTLEQVALQRDQLATMGEASQKLVQKFSPEIIVGNIHKTCQELLEKNK